MKHFTALEAHRRADEAKDRMWKAEINSIMEKISKHVESGWHVLEVDYVGPKLKAELERLGFVVIKTTPAPGLTYFTSTTKDYKITWFPPEPSVTNEHFKK